MFELHLQKYASSINQFILVWEYQD